ncbi:DUF1330 domain-containing protein [Pectobacterium quasiaquaticum]|uniref:DUF1330 domain-containing protein n=1 Tax=Pectobacterium quasiaquaticum TaxID=2774015 RepID=A0A9Q2ESU7_9GAMM|nr:DUF1330 domain-containing protein [Pectobacterium quasiaquaticum]URG49306.1 DUF1330 domain-containing protein [Pectobacterium quasiaquaticum]
MSIKSGAVLIATLCVSFVHPASWAADPAQVKPHAFYVADFIPRDSAAIRPYSTRVESTFAPYSGRYVVRGGSVLPLEGVAPMGRMIVIEFDSLEQAKAWYDSLTYAELKPIRHAAGETNAYIMEASVAPPVSK